MIIQKLRVRRTAPQGSGTCTRAAPASISATSAALTPPFCVGLSRNQPYQTMAQTMPNPPKHKNDCRQPYRIWIGTTTIGVNPAPKRPAIQIMLWARARSATGNHRATTAELLGYAPASPAPNRNRTISSERKLLTKPVIVVNADHQITILLSVFLGPKRSPIAPLGISKRE